jgi:putative pyruvate formate lyase activating enzyme
LPNKLAGSEKIFEFIAKEISKNTWVNVMAQYTPYWKAEKYPELNRKITKEEFKHAVNLAKKFGLNLIF